MNQRREYEIAFVGLKPGEHEYNYLIEDKFFTLYEQQDFTNCKANVKLLLDKHSGFMMLKFEVGGTIDTTCDRCGNTFTLPLWDEFNIVVKLSDEPDVMNEQEEDPDVYYISRTESHLHIADWIYEFILLSIPSQKQCSDAPDGLQCNEEVLEKLKQMSADNQPKTNSLWKDLDQFKNLSE